MTYNIGGGRKDFGSAIGDVVKVIQEVSPDILVVQEATDFQDADSDWHSVLSQVARAGECGKHVHFGPTLSMREHMHVGKDLFVHGIFSDWRDWRQGNGLLSRWEFVRLGDPSKPGLPEEPNRLLPLPGLDFLLEKGVAAKGVDFGVWNGYARGQLRTGADHVAGQLE